jgi:hypothetical protein
MMDAFTRQHLRRLAEATAEPAVSIYIPSIRAGREVQQNAIRFKNLLKRAATQLTDQGAYAGELRKRFSEVGKLEADEEWWQYQSDCLAVFLAADRQELYRLPIQVNERVVIGPRFHVTPLIPLVQTEGRFYVLAVSQNAVRLLEGLRDEIGAEAVLLDEGIGKVSLVGAGMKTHPGVAAKMFSALSAAGVNIEMISTSTIRVSVVIAKGQVETAVQAVHAAFELGEDAPVDEAQNA